MQGILRFLIIMLVCAGFAGAQTNIVYRLIGSRQSGAAEAIKEFDYNVSVGQNLDVSGVKNIICRLIRSEKPAGYDILGIGIYYNLDRYAAEKDGEQKDSIELREHRIAQYHWNKESPKDARRLVLNKDAKGQPLTEWRFYNFDHTKACR